MQPSTSLVNSYHQFFIRQNLDTRSRFLPFTALTSTPLIPSLSTGAELYQSQQHRARKIA